MGLFDLWTNSFIDNVFRDTVTPKLGSVVHCDLSAIPIIGEFGLKAEHTGIYVGNGMIIHRDGDGYLAKVSPRKFLKRLNGKNCAISVYVSCKGTKPLCIMGAFNRARAALNNQKLNGYDLLNKNCHNFTRYCLTGDFDDEQDELDFTFSSLEELLQDEFDMDNWRVWDSSDY